MLTAFVILSFAPTASGNTFLKKDPNRTTKFLESTTIEKLFLDEVRGVTGKGAVDAQIPAIKAALEPMWLALPKNQYGGLDNAQVRYALHRLFVQRHGWYLDGLTVTNDTSTAGIMQSFEKVPNFIMELFEEAFGQTGLKLHELAVFAGTLERLIHTEAINRLKNVYAGLQLETDAAMNQADAEKALKAFLASYIVGKDLSTPAALEAALGSLERSYPSWNDAQAFLKSTAEAVQPELFAAEQSANFEQMQNVSEETSMRLGGFLEKECQKIKNVLLEVEERDSGRVLLSNFYKKGLEKGLLFVEKEDYLRQLGALDESGQGEPRLIVSNFIVSPNNCLVDTGFYSVCCLNECESVMSELENKIAAPEATPEQILAVIANLATSTVAAPREIPQRMVGRLEMVAERNQGKVPIYGRLFSQWLHFAFPRECPYPHISGSTTPLTISDYKAANSATTATLKGWEMRAYINKNTKTVEQGAEEETPPAEEVATQESSLPEHAMWQPEEEHLFLPTDAPRSISAMLLRAVLGLAMLACFVFAGAEVAQRVAGVNTGLLPKMEKAHLV